MQTCIALFACRHSQGHSSLSFVLQHLQVWTRSKPRYAQMQSPVSRLVWVLCSLQTHPVPQQLLPKPAWRDNGSLTSSSAVEAKTTPRAPYGNLTPGKPQAFRIQPVDASPPSLISKSSNATSCNCIRHLETKAGRLESHRTKDASATVCRAKASTAEAGMGCCVCKLL